MMLSLFLFSSLNVYAAVYPSLDLGTTEDSGAVKTAMITANGIASRCGIPKFNGVCSNAKQFVGVDGTSIYINKQGYNKLSADEKQEVMAAALSCARNITTTQLRLKVYNFIADQDTSTSSLVRQLSNDVDADFATAYSWFKPFSGGVSTFLGLMTLGIFITLTCMITVDLAYLVIPPFRQVLDKDGKEKPNFISNEAFKATLEAEKDNLSYKSSMALYFKHKTVQLIVIAICLLYLVSGKIYSLVAWFIDAFSGVTG